MKQAIRKQIINQRKLLSPDEKKQANKRIILRIRQDKRYQQAKTVAIFYPMFDEINLLDLLADKKVFLFPKVVGNHIIFYPYQHDMRFVKSAFGVYEPNEGEPFKQQIDYMLVPALAIDKDNNRIGYGKGFYDRYLATNRPKHVIGVIYDFQLIEHIEGSSFDQKLDDCMRG